MRGSPSLPGGVTIDAFGQQHRVATPRGRLGDVDHMTASCFAEVDLHLLRRASASKLEDDEQIAVHKVFLEEALRKISSGEIMDAKTMVGLLGLGRMRPEIRGA